MDSVVSSGPMDSTMEAGYNIIASSRTLPSTPRPFHPNPRGTALYGIVLVAAMVLWVSGCCWYGMRCYGLGRAQSGGVVSHGVDTIMVAVLYGMVSHSMWYTVCGSGSVSEC